MYNVANPRSKKSNSLDVQSFMAHFRKKPALTTRLDNFWGHGANDEQIAQEF